MSDTSNTSGGIFFTIPQDTANQAGADLMAPRETLPADEQSNSDPADRGPQSIAPSVSCPVDISTCIARKVPEKA